MINLAPPLPVTTVALSSANREADAMQAVLEVAASVAASLDLDALLDRVLDAIQRLVPTERSSITLDQPGRDRLRIVKVRGEPDYVAQLLGQERDIHGSLTGRCYSLREPYLVDDLLNAQWRQYIYLAPGHPVKHANLRSGLFMPLVADCCVGVVFLSRAGVGRFTAEDLHILSLFAPLVAIAVTNARRYEAVQEQARGLRALLRVSEILSQHAPQPDGDRVARTTEMLTQVSHEVVRHASTYVWRTEPDSERVCNVGAMVNDAPAPRDPDQMLGVGLLGEAIAHGQIVLLNDRVATPEIMGAITHPVPAHRIIVPLVPAQGSRGALVLGRDDAPFSADELARVQIMSRQAVAAIERVVFLQRLQEQNTALLAANRHKDTFLTHMSHELRTPLNAVIGFARLLTDDVPLEDDERAAVYQDILESGQHLLTLVNHVLDVARIESGQERLTCVPLPLTATLAAVERMTAPLFAAKQQTFALDAPAPAPVVCADAERLRQVLLNLLSNAHKFTPAGGSIVLRAFPAADGYVRIAVTDTGIGIAPEHHSLIFESFRQVETGYTRAQQGTGLGLALTRQLVELMNGTITLTSSPNAGSVFTVSLPAVV